MNWRHSFARKREVHKNGENFSDNLGNEPVCRSCDSDSGNLLKSSGKTLWGKMAVSGVACGGDTALRRSVESAEDMEQSADTAEPAGANGDNAGTGAFGAEQHTRGTGAENTGLFCAEGYGRADRAGNADCPCGADTGGKRGKEGCL